jgi:hypothetical protein
VSYRRARAAYTAHRLKNAVRTAQDAFDWLDSHLAVRSGLVDCAMFVTPPTLPEHLVARRSRPPCHGFVGPPPRATPRSAALAPHVSEAPDSSPRRRCLSPISAANQLSRAPAGSLHSRALGLAPFRPITRGTKPPEPAPACGGRAWLVRDGAGLPREGRLRPRVTAGVEEPRHQLRSWSPSPSGWPGFPGLELAPAL